METIIKINQYLKADPSTLINRCGIKYGQFAEDLTSEENVNKPMNNFGEYITINVTQLQESL